LGNLGAPKPKRSSLSGLRRGEERIDVKIRARGKVENKIIKLD